MTDQKKPNQGSGLNSIVAAVTGVVIGAGIAAAGVLALKDKKNRQQVKEALTKVKDQAVDYVKTLKAQPEIIEGEKVVKKVVANTKKVVEKSK